jgi:hypothetical protein
MLSNPRIVHAAFISIGVILLILIAYLYHRRRRGKGAKEPLALPQLDRAGHPSQADSLFSAAPEDSAGPPSPPRTPAFATIHGRPWIATDLLRALLILLSLVVAAGFILILLPKPAVDRMAQDLQSRRGSSEQEKIAFLYLGDEVKNSEFHVRGVVRNITAEPIEQLDAAVRLYSHDGSILETVIVRMNKETIAPDEIAQFELVYPNYQSEFGSYSVEFKLRQGAFVHYKDMRGTRK